MNIHEYCGMHKENGSKRIEKHINQRIRKLNMMQENIKIILFLIKNK